MFSHDTVPARLDVPGIPLADVDRRIGTELPTSGSFITDTAATSPGIPLTPVVPFAMSSSSLDSQQRPIAPGGKSPQFTAHDHRPHRKIGAVLSQSYNIFIIH